MLTKGHRRKQQIIDTAKDMFIDYGFQSTHIGKVCEELNIARGTVYQYFGNKREILYAILESVEEAIDDLLDRDDLNDFLKTNSTHKSLIEYINNRISAAINTLISETIILKLIFKDITGIDRGVIKRINKFIEFILKAIENNIGELFKKGLCRRELNPHDVSQIMMGGILFMANNHYNKQNNKIEKNIIGDLVNNYIQGLLK